MCIVVSPAMNPTPSQPTKGYINLNNMATFDKGRILKQLKLDEGFKAKAYWDNKQWTVGYGTRGSKGEVLTKEEAVKRLDKHVAIAEKGFDFIFKGHDHKFNEVRTEAFMNMIFNMGLGSMLGFRRTLGVIKDHEEVDWNRVAQNLTESLWYRQVGDRAKRIVEEVRTGEKV